MKVKTAFFFAFHVTAWIIASSCEKTDIGPTPDLVQPEILVRFNPQRLSGSEVRADLRATVTFPVDVVSFPQGFSATGFRVFRKLNNDPEQLLDDSKAGSPITSSFDYPYTLGDPKPAGTGTAPRKETFRDNLTIRFSVTSSSGAVFNLSYLIRINRDPNAPDIPPGPISSYTNIRMITVSLNSNNSLPQFFSSSNGIAYSANALLANPAATTPNVDFGPTVAAAAGSLPAISSIDAMAASFDPVIGPVRPFQKTIQFKGSSMTSEQFDNIRDDIPIIQAWENGDAAHPDLRVNNRRMINLNAGRIFVFQTDPTKFGGAKLGVIRVKSVTPSDGSGNADVVIDVKVQAAPKPISTYSDVDLITVSNNSDNSKTAFFSVDRGRAFSVNQLVADYAGIGPSIDFGPTVAAAAGSVPAISSIDVWSAAYDPVIGGIRPFQRTIQFKGTSTTSAQFDAITSDAALVQAWENGDAAHPDLRVNNRRFINATPGKIFVFQTDPAKPGGPKIGIMRVTANTVSDGASNASVRVDIKVQQ